MRVSLILFFFMFFYFSAFAQQNKLDQLDKQSQQFFNAITGLEQDYIQEQLKKMKEIAKNKPKHNSTKPEEKVKISDPNKYMRELIEKDTNNAQLASELAKTKNLSNIMIKSIYEFNGKKYVLLQQDKANNQATKEEFTISIEGRFKRGDKILNHRIVYINKRTKTVTLYKKIDDEYGYFVYLNNQGISVSDLKKIVKKQNSKKPEVVTIKKSSSKPKVKSIIIPEPKKIIENTNNLNKTTPVICKYTLKLNRMNVRDNTTGGTILRVLDKHDTVMGEYMNGWLLIDEIHKYNTHDILNVKGLNNWVRMKPVYFNASNPNCF